MQKLFLKNRSTKNSIHNILLSSYLITMLLILFITTLIYTISQYYNMKSNIIKSIQQTCSSVANDVDTQINQIDTVCINVIYSTMIKDTFSTYQDLPGESYGQSIINNQLTGLLTAIRGANSMVRQINLYDLEQGCFGTGNYTGFRDISTAEQSWYEATIANDGNRYIPPAEQNELISSSTGTNKDRYYLSLYRLYFDNFHQPSGIVEIMEYYDITFARALQPESSYDIDIIIYDPEGTVIFPVETKSSDLYNYFDHKDDKSLTIKNTLTGHDEFICYEQMQHCGFTTVVAIEKTKIFAPIYKYLLIVFLILIIAALLCFAIAYNLSRRLSAPLGQMYHYLSGQDIKKHWSRLTMPDSNIIEIDKLKDSLNEFQARQKSSLNALMLLKEQELQSQMLALQSQMNPHFLYNSLATLSAMAEEEMTGEISQMCIDITAILRYISSNKQTLATLEEELEHASLYLKCLQLRYGSSLTFDFDVEDQMLELPVPKLCLQLLVENSVKFSTKAAPPWHIRIQGFCTGEHWVISVMDNGIGFSPEIIETLNQKREEIQSNGLLPSLELDGMGLMNIYIRFYLAYHFAFIFDFGNLPDGGAIVTIGGKFND